MLIGYDDPGMPMNVNRRDFLRIGGPGLCGVHLLNVLQAQAATGRREPRARAMIVCWLAGGPPHTDMFDMKPDAPVGKRSEFGLIPTSVPGYQISELLPNLARRADRYTIIRSISTLNEPGNHGEAPLYWLTGNPRRTRGTEDYPMIGSVVSHVRPGPADLPRFVTLGRIDMPDGSHNRLAHSFLGPAHAPFIFDPFQPNDAMTRMLVPQHELPTFARHADLLRSLDQGLREQDRLDPLVEGLDRNQQTAFNLLRSPKLRAALDVSREPLASRDRYARLGPDKFNDMIGNPMHFLMARRLVEVGVPVVHFSLGYWDWHSDNFKSGRKQIPMFDAALAHLLDDLEARGLLDSTIVLALGEMGRGSSINGGKGRDHNDHAQFVLAAGGGFQRGAVIGATDRFGDRVADRFYKIESFARTLYQLLGIDHETTLTTPGNRPVRLIVEDAPLIKEAIL